MPEHAGLLTDILVLLGAFFLGFLAGVALGPVRRVLKALWRSPGRAFRGAQNVSARLWQAFKASPPDEDLDRTGVTGALAGAISDALTLRVRRAEASFRAGMAAFESGDYPLARRKFTQAMLWDGKRELKALHVLAHLRLGWLDEERGAWPNAREHYAQAARLDPDNLTAAVRLGMTHFRLEETGPAIFQFQRALELDPADLDTHYFLYAIYRQAAMEREAIEQLRIIKAGESPGRLADLFARHGEDHFRLGRHAEAMGDYDLALQFDPERLELYAALGDLYHLQKRPRTALEMWCRGLWLGYDDALAERVLAVAPSAAPGEEPSPGAAASQADGLLDTWAVVQLLRECISRHPRDGRYHLLLARLLRQLGEHDESLSLLQQAARLTPVLLEAQIELGDWYGSHGQDARASETYRDGLRAAQTRETVYRCRACGYLTRQEQPRCFECNRWGTLQRTTRGQAQSTSLLPWRVAQRATAVRRTVTSLWSRVAGQLPPGDTDRQGKPTCEKDLS